MSGPEAKIQEKVKNHVKAKGGTAIKLTSAGFRGVSYGTTGWPDYLFLLPGQKVIFIEFKAPGKVCTELQLQRHAELRRLGFMVRVCDDAGLGKQIIDDLIVGRGVKDTILPGAFK